MDGIDVALVEGGPVTEIDPRWGISKILPALGVELTVGLAAE